MFYSNHFYLNLILIVADKGYFVNIMQPAEIGIPIIEAFKFKSCFRSSVWSTLTILHGFGGYTAIIYVENVL